MVKKIVGIAEQFRPGIEPYGITIDDENVTCDDPFHTRGEGGTAAADVGGGWMLRHCARVDCDGTARLHAVIDNASGVLPGEVFQDKRDEREVP